MSQPASMSTQALAALSTRELVLRLYHLRGEQIACRGNRSATHSIGNEIARVHRILAMRPALGERKQLQAEGLIPEWVWL